jgi:hypothetical protein
MRKTIVAMFALAAVGLFQPTAVSAGGIGAGGSYPASFGSDNDYAKGGDCRLVAHRHDAPRLANTTSSGLQLISVSVERGPPVRDGGFFFERGAAPRCPN